MSKTRRGGKGGGDRKGGSDRKSGRIGYLLRFHSDRQKAELERLAAADGVSLSKFLLGLSDRALAEKRESDAKAQAVEVLKRRRDAKWDELVRLWQDLGLGAGSAKKDRWLELGKAMDFDLSGLRNSMGAGDPAPAMDTGRGYSQLVKEVRALVDYYIQHRESSSTRLRGFSTTAMETLLEEFLAIEEELDRAQGYDSREHADRKWTDRNARVKPEFQRYDDDAADDDEVDEGDEFYQIDEFK